METLRHTLPVSMNTTLSTIKDVARPETIICERCGNTVPVKARGPVPSYCASCRRTRRKTTAPRPATVPCQTCGRPVAVAERGPLPRTCRGGCRPQESPEPPVTATVAPPDARTGPRPWDHSPVEVDATPPPAPLPPPLAITATRIDAVGGVLMGARTIERRVWINRVRRAAATAAWILFVLIIGLIVMFGGRPAPL